MVRLILTAILLVVLTACGTVGLEPSSQVVQRALVKLNEVIALQLDEPQQLNFDFKGFEINRVAITQQEPLVIQNLPAYHVRGIYNLTLKLPGRRVNQQQNPFDIYLQRQKEGKTWRLALPQLNGKDNNLTWRTYLIQ